MKKNRSAKFQKTKRIFVIVLLCFVLSGTILTYQVIYNTGIGKLINNSEKLTPDKLAIKMNANIIFSSDDSEGRILIENKKTNVHNIIVEIYLDNDETLIYKSKLLKPGEKIEKDKLDVKLAPAEYKATAYFNAYDDSNNFMGKSGVKIKITIKE